MKVFVSVFASLLAVSSGFAARGARSIREIPGAVDSLRRTVSPKFYRSLLVSSVEGWIVVKGTLVKDHLVNPQLIHSELNGAYDSLAVELANNLHVQHRVPDQVFSRSRAVLVHLLIYQIADGKMALSFARLDETGTTQIRYFGAAWMGALKKDQHEWREIEPLALPLHDARPPRTFTLYADLSENNSLVGRGNVPLLIGGNPRHTTFNR